MTYAYAAAPYASPARLAPISILALAYAFCTAWAMVPVSGATYLSFSDVLALPALLYLLLRRFDVQPLASSLYLGYLLAAALAAVASFFIGAADSLWPLAFIVRAFAIFFPFLVVFYVREFDYAFMSRLIWAAIIGCGLSVTIGIVMHVLGIEAREGTQRLWLGGGQGSTTRAAGLTGNSGSYGILLSFWGSLVLFIAPALRMRIPLLLSVAAFLLVSYGLIVSSSRGGMIQFAAAGILYVVFIYAQNLPRAVLTLTIGASLLSGLVFAVASSVNFYDLPLPVQTSLTRLDVFNLTGQSQFAQTTRLETWGQIDSFIAEHFLWGVGYQQFFDRFGFFIDNAYLLALIESGIFAFVLFMAFWTYLVIFLLSAIAKGSLAGRVGMIVVIPFMLRMFTGGAHTDWSIAPVIFLIAAAVLRIAMMEIRSLPPHGQIPS